MNKRTKKNTLILLAILLTSIAIIALTRALTESTYLAELDVNSTNALKIQSVNAQTYTEKYGIAASMLSRRQDITDFILDTQNISDTSNTRNNILRLLNHTNGLTGSDNIWLVDINGNVLLHSDNIQKNTQFPPLNIASEDYFKTAMQGRLGRANFIQNTAAHFYLFAAPVISENRIIGATVIQISMEHLEQTWALISNPIIVLDKDNNILLSNIKSWRLQKFDLSNQQNNSNTSNQQTVVLSRQDRTITTNAINQTQGIQHFLIHQKDIPLLEWKLLILQDEKFIKNRVNDSTFVAILILSLLWLLLWFLWHRNQRGKLERQQQIEFARQLEERVKRRTKAVSVANQQLESEVEERKATEQELRRTQKELIQSAKMASIGQMSTVLAHEYNQPISAIQFYAANAQTLINDKQHDEALDNMSRINELTKRMASLTSSLRNFAHKPSQQLQKVNLSNVIEQLITLMQPRLKAENVNVFINPAINPSTNPAINSAPEDLIVMAGNTRLTQVLSNLIANSIDALKNQDNKEITLEWRAKGSELVEILIKDNGPGIPANQREKLYDAFYTTKGNEDGLGLGLFIVYNLITELSGKLTILDQPDFGAVFCIELERQYLDDNE